LTDLEALGALFMANIVLPAFAAHFLAARKRDWRSRKIALISALPLPLIILALCLFVFLQAAFASKASCGVDACGMAMAFSMIIAFWAAMSYLLGVGAAVIVLRVERR
jgi:hypothetical protein